MAAASDPESKSLQAMYPLALPSWFLHRLRFCMLLGEGGGVCFVDSSRLSEDTREILKIWTACHMSYLVQAWLVVLGHESSYPVTSTILD